MAAPHGGLRRWRLEPESTHPACALFCAIAPLVVLEPPERTGPAESSPPQRQFAGKICSYPIKACGNDPERVFDYYQTRQDQLKATGEYKFVTKPLATLSAASATEQRDERER